MNGYCKNEGMIRSILTHLFLDQRLYLIYDSSQTYVNPKPEGTNSIYGMSVEMMVFTLESLIQKHCDVSIKDSKRIFHQCFSTLLVNLTGGHPTDFIKALESFNVGGWKRIYTILVNIIGRMLEDN